MRKILFLVLLIIITGATSSLISTCTEEEEKTQVVEKVETITLKSFYVNEMKSYKQLDLASLQLGSYSFVRLDAGSKVDGKSLAKSVIVLSTPTATIDLNGKVISNYVGTDLFPFVIFDYPYKTTADIVCWLHQKFPTPARLFPFDNDHKTRKTMQFPIGFNQLPCGEAPNVEPDEIIRLGDSDLPLTYLDKDSIEVTLHKYSKIIASKKDINIAREDGALVKPHPNWVWNAQWRANLNKAYKVN